MINSSSDIFLYKWWRERERQHGSGGGDEAGGRGQGAQREAARRPAATASSRAPRASRASCCCADAPTHAALSRYPADLARLCRGPPRGSKLRQSHWGSWHRWRHHDPRAPLRCANAQTQAPLSRHPADLARLCRAARRPRLWQLQPRRSNWLDGNCVTAHPRSVGRLFQSRRTFYTSCVNSHVARPTHTVRLYPVV